MSRRRLRAILILLGLGAAIVAAVALLLTNGVRDAAVLVGIATMLVLAYLLRRRTRADLLYNETTNVNPHDATVPRSERSM